MLGNWKDILHFIYHGESLDNNTTWKAVSFVKYLVQLGSKRVVVNGSTINYWHDT